ncbi:MAG TPA: adenylate/guanylate cyclase domain-containing protein, partial [Candidatus Ozemobacteraceae bacterium]|nr:adenylate/guanylate cyclase domain-containing protein [Candidatus Ozemobacteraceae bacterium]
WYGRGRLLKPLERLRLAMLEVASGRFDTRMPTDRSDEFGTLAIAFNSMAKALQEAAILGRFVSGSVRRAVHDRRADESGRGERREVTILFSCLFHFEQLCHDRDAAFIFGALGEHLGAFNAELKQFAGAAEIDKIIGDKILVVFDHERLGGRAAAAGAVLSVVRGVRRRITELHLETAMGINTGMVISGILGAKSVRLDHTVIGDPVNLASRLSLLAHMTDGTRTVLSGAFLDACDGTIRTEKLPFRKVKGKTQEVEAYLLMDDVCVKNTHE